MFNGKEIEKIGNPYTYIRELERSLDKASVACYISEKSNEALRTKNALLTLGILGMSGVITYVWYSSKGFSIFRQNSPNNVIEVNNVVQQNQDFEPGREGEISGDEFLH